ncbi:Uncharacterised protein [Serratia fonticola]|nr:Uncharacterised protein [Serratia fonticola]
MAWPGLLVPLRVCDVCASAALSTSSPASLLTVSTGAAKSTVMFSCALALCPALSVTVALSVVEPLASAARSAAGSESDQLPSP